MNSVPRTLEGSTRRRWRARAKARLATVPRALLVTLVAAQLAALGATPIGAQTLRNDEVLRRDNQRAVDRGLAFLARTQNADGAWYSDVGFKLMESYEVTATVESQEIRGGGHVGVTALACMAFMAGGNLPGRGKYGAEIERGLDYVLGCVGEDGYVSDNGTRMYSHAFATLFLAEIYGMTQRKDVRDALQRAVDLIVKSQNKLGSWRYLPFAPDSDMSITVCQIMALRAARNIGIRVPRSTIDRAIEYVKDSAYTSGPYRGGFKYQMRNDQPTRTSFALTAAGITTLHNAGVYSDRLIEEGLRYLRDEFHEMSDRIDHYFYFYGHYYAVQAMYIAGGNHWEWYWPRIQAELIAAQNKKDEGSFDYGSWDNNVAPAFGTAVATLILQIPNQYLPIFQR